MDNSILEGLKCLNIFCKYGTYFPLSAKQAISKRTQNFWQDAKFHFKALLSKECKAGSQSGLFKEVILQNMALRHIWRREKKTMKKKYIDKSMLHLQLKNRKYLPGIKWNVYSVGSHFCGTILHHVFSRRGNQTDWPFTSKQTLLDNVVSLMLLSISCAVTIKRWIHRIFKHNIILTVRLASRWV